MPSCDYRMADLHALVADVTSYARHPAKASGYTCNLVERAARRAELEQAALKMRGTSCLAAPVSG